jgi:Rad3-related DNA helicase
MAMFRDFHASNLPIFCLSFGIIMLLPKEQEAKKSNNIERTVEREQTAFLPGRYILEGLVILHETIHELKRKKQNGDELSILQYAYDTILLLDDDLEKAKNLQLVLSAFQNLSGLKINFHKSEVFSFGETKERVSGYVELFGCKEGTRPFRY